MKALQMVYIVDKLIENPSFPSLSLLPSFSKDKAESYKLCAPEVWRTVDQEMFWVRYKYTTPEGRHIGTVVNKLKKRSHIHLGL